MSKANLFILSAVAIVAVVFLFNYAMPSEKTWGADPRVSQTEVREILLLEAYNYNVSISDQEYRAAYLGLLNKSGMSNESYGQYVAEKHGSQQAFEQTVRENLMVLKFINQQVNWSRITIDNATVDDYISQNSQIFPAEQLSDPTFKDQFYRLAKQQMFEKQRQELVNEFVKDTVERHN